MAQGMDSDSGGSGNTSGKSSTSLRTSLSLAIQQRRRSHSTASSFTSGTNASPHRSRTSTGPISPSQDERPPAHSRNLSSSSRFVTSSTDFHLPQRTLTSSGYAASLISPNSGVMLASAAAGEDGQGGSAKSSLPLLRRKAAAAALAHASRKGLRRGSMLGKEVAKNINEGANSEEDEDMDGGDGFPNNRRVQLSEFPVGEEDQEDDMQIDTGDVTVSGVELDGKASGSSSPPNMNMQRTSVTNTAIRRAVQRRTNLMPRDRGVLRVAASLRDETRPADGEIASEAKLQRRLGPESDSVAPTTPKLLARRSQSPFGPSSGGLLERGIDGDDFYFPDGAAHFDLSDDSDYDGDDDMIACRTGHNVPLDSEGIENFDAGIAIPGSNGEASQKEKLWLNFRESGNPRLSPGVERTTTRSRGASVAPGGGGINVAAAAPLSGSLGSALDHAMELESFPHMGSSPSLWGRSAKRKVGDDRYDPYSASALHKRRAVSPIAFVTGNVNSRGQTITTNTTLSPGINSQASPMYIHAANSHPMTVNLPTPTPLSIPSPTLSMSRIPGLSGSFPRSFPSAPNRAGMTASTNPSPSSTRPSTPTNSVPPPNYFGSGPSPSLLSSSASKAMGGVGGGPSGGNTGPQNGGSGPGYGSGALGLSLGGGSKRYKEEQEEMEEEEGMLGDVSAIKLGEM